MESVYSAVRTDSLYKADCVASLTPNDPYRGLTAPITSKRSILYIYSTNIGNEYFKHGIYSPVFFVRVLFTFYIQGVLKLKKIIPAPKG